VLNLANKGSRKPHLYQLYQKLYWEKLKDRLNEEYATYVTTIVTAGKMPKTVLVWRNERCRELLEEESDEVKAIVQKAYNSARGGRSVSASQEPTYEEGDSPEQVHNLRMSYYERCVIFSQQ
jgi:hypothetical protein